MISLAAGGMTAPSGGAAYGAATCGGATGATAGAPNRPPVARAGAGAPNIDGAGAGAPNRPPVAGAGAGVDPKSPPVAGAGVAPNPVGFEAKKTNDKKKEIVSVT